MARLQSVKGMHDILPQEMPRWHFLEGRYRETVERFGYQEIRTPILEPLELFVRGIGEDTDIVEKEMYAFEDKGNDWVALRPEGTASAMRAYIQHNLGGLETISKLYYIGPMFRRERPAKGRYRQFYQAGAELVGAAEPTADAEIIGMAVSFVESLGIEDVNVQINTLGDRDTRPRYREALVAHYSGSVDALCTDCRRRLDTNPLRVLDCKVEACREVSRSAPVVQDYLGEEASEHFREVLRLLDRNGTRCTVVPRMVRGLDYYTRTIFEIQGKAEGLGAQATIVGGGRYDDLVEQLGGKRVPTIGFAFGMDRLLLMMSEDKRHEPRPTVYVAAVGAGGMDRAVDLAWRLRRRGAKVEVPYSGSSLKSQLKRADKVRARIVIIAGEDEAARGAVTVRDMRAGTQEEVSLLEIENRIEAIE